MFDLIFNNAFVKTIKGIINFCNEQSLFFKKKLTFSSQTQSDYAKQYDDRFLFNGKLKVENEK